MGVAIAANLFVLFVLNLTLTAMVIDQYRKKEKVSSGANGLAIFLLVVSIIGIIFSALYIYTRRS
jgi:hypothetical protein